MAQDTILPITMGKMSRQQQEQQQQQQQKLAADSSSQPKLSSS
jgi:hypothetical protein